MRRLTSILAGVALALALVGPASAAGRPGGLFLDAICHTGGASDSVNIGVWWFRVRPVSLHVGAGIGSADAMTFYAPAYDVTSKPNVRTASFSVPMSWFTTHGWVWAQVQGVNRFGGTFNAFVDNEFGAIVVGEIPLCE